ncbi:hypothetical protein CMO94_04165 [Candidatus Woesearchaeota archaeon]|jgi:hypothetical protein|nr:hypothetical protein [Candidatus Woesearchaeota archaeon]|tara:strand:+ start:433 stop:906 length:474 start_codon:yes stop_codon:yes gene_type:complete
MENYLFFALMYNNNEILKKTINKLNFGAILSKSPEYDFDFTDHYENEFGSDLKKTIIIFNNNIQKNNLIKIKNKINEIEKDYSADGKRTINIDPGYVNDKEVVLASFKKKRFKENLGDGVFAHKVLEFEDGKVKEFFHTFPDFKSKLVKEFFLNNIK